MRLAALALCTLIPFVAAAQRGGAPDAAALARFDAALEKLRKDKRIPGMSAAVGRGGTITWQKAYGLADIAANRAVTPATPFHLASLTKPFAAVVLLRLVDSGVVSLDDPASKFGVIVQNTGTVRVRHLLSMTAGDPAPGDRYQYDGNKFALLGSVIYSASGKAFEELLAQWITKPLGLMSTAANVDNALFRFSGLDARTYRAAMARGYDTRKKTPSPLAYPTHTSAAAGMISTPSDVIMFMHALQAGAIIKPASRDMMFTPNIGVRGDTLPYGFGIFSQNIRGVRVVWAYGLWTAISSLLVHVPDRDLTFVIAANSDELSADYSLGNGRLLNSPYANEFLNTFVFR
jgi:CubicO group peptidase (beta-lactamase class C family)